MLAIEYLLDKQGQCTTFLGQWGHIDIKKNNKSVHVYI